MQGKLIAIWEFENRGGQDMSYNFKETMNKLERLAPGHRICAG